MEKENKNLGEFILPIIDSLKRNSLYDKTSKFEGEIIEKNIIAKQETIKGQNFINGETITECIQKGRLILGKDKLIYIGELYHYKPHGKGTIYKIKKVKKKKTLIYCGDFANGKYEGNGILYDDYKKKTYYEGEFHDNKKNGKGKYYNNNKLVYEGEFSEDKYHGKGKIYYEDGTTYEGEFNNGVRNGMGVEYDTNNKIKIQGEFEDGINPMLSLVNKIHSNSNINEINNSLNEFLSCGRGILQIFGMQTHFVCNNCQCSTDAHFLIGESMWKCRNCNKMCQNNLLLNMLS